ncbi:hypothetical protein COLO4_32095 [Corchorus olitorius]|uniref:Reverse transcriptase RNase H-like domain-containing protein n=1 Tax=Corchorus olitorius TaxID=93759 RepID=A0A1R3H1K5_9ROSI|nr:hypothetical protein COLO4_32095 [Corchorus olitorius]
MAHYHSTFKEILGVKYGIQKFEFHLIGHHFIVELDMAAFDQMLDVKKKTVPNPQLLRWSQWFTCYSFTTRHIKGKHPYDPGHNPIREIQMMEAGSSNAPSIPSPRQAVFYQDPPISADGVLDIKPFYNRLLTLPPDPTKPIDIVQALLGYERNPYKFLDPPQAFIAEDLPTNMSYQGLVSSLPQEIQDKLALFSIQAKAKEELFKFQSIIN